MLNDPVHHREMFARTGLRHRELHEAQAGAGIEARGLKQLARGVRDHRRVEALITAAADVRGAWISIVNTDDAEAGETAAVVWINQDD